MTVEQLVLRIPGGKDGVRIGLSSFHEPTILAIALNDLPAAKLFHTATEY
jgi:hypothetical protein